VGGRRSVQGDVRKGDNPAIVVARLHTEALNEPREDMEMWRRGPGKVRHHVQVQRRGRGCRELDRDMDDLLFIALAAELLGKPGGQPGRDLPGNTPLMLVVEPKQAVRRNPVDRTMGLWVRKSGVGKVRRLPPRRMRRTISGVCRITLPRVWPSTSTQSSRWVGNHGSSGAKARERSAKRSCSGNRR
jgi:hypothetical protein